MTSFLDKIAFINGKEPLPDAIANALQMLEPGVPHVAMPMREMTPKELIELEREHERTKIREHIAALHRSVDPVQQNAVHEAAVAEQVALYETKLKAIK